VDDTTHDTPHDTPHDTVAALCAAVAERVPVDDRERLSQGLFLATIAELTVPYSEHADGRHVTASAIVVGARGVVLHRHKRLGIWLQPGGHIESGETAAQAALREAAEETGLPVRHPVGGPRFVHVDVHPGPRCAAHLDVRYLIEADDVDPAPGPDESQDVRWFTWDEAIALAEPGLLGALTSLRP
jgi:8-oxo-dGTP pyrophosphatase MutT (NUDIX family)